MEIRSNDKYLFICHQGVERSRAAKNALTDNGYLASHFEEGTDKLKNMAHDKIREICTEEGLKVHLIYDQGSPRVEYDDMEQATEVLRKLGIKWKQISTNDLICAL